MGKKLVLIDFDGTLLRDDKKVSRKDMQTLKMLRQKNVCTAIATGRSLYSFQKALKHLNLSEQSYNMLVDYVIFSTGAGIVDCRKDELLFKKNIPKSDIKGITDRLDIFKLDYMVLKAIPETRYFLYRSNGNDNPDFQSRLALYQEYAAPLMKDHVHQDSATEVLAILPGGVRTDMLKAIRQALPDFSVIHATSPLDHQSAWIEVFHKDVSKSSTGSVLAEMLNIAKEDTIGIGNDYNDQDLLDWAGKSFVVDNAPLELKEKYQIVASNNQSGVTQAIEMSGLI